jgi:hypothetical protein
MGLLGLSHCSYYIYRSRCTEGSQTFRCRYTMDKQ